MPPRTPCFPGGSPPPGPPKKRSAPLAAEVGRFLSTEPLVRGSCAAWGRTFSQKSDLFLNKPLVRAAALPGAELFLKDLIFLNKPLVRGSCAAWGRTFSQKSDSFFEQATCPGSCAAWGRTFSQKSDFFFAQATCPGSCVAWGRTFSQKSDSFLNKPLVGAAALPGVELFL